MQEADKMNKPVILVMIVLFSLPAVLLSGCGKTDRKTAGPENAKKIYLAGPFFNDREIENVEYAEKILQEKGFSLFSPMRHSVDTDRGTPEWARMIFEMDREEIKKADVVVALYYGAYSDTGTAWECGYAAALGITVVLVHADREAGSNLMMHAGCTTNIDLEDLADYDFDQMPVYEYTGKMF
jgi:nucleoside 2-deoxyribosyltransferase